MSFREPRANIHFFYSEVNKQKVVVGFHEKIKIKCILGFILSKLSNHIIVNALLNNCFRYTADSLTANRKKKYQEVQCQSESHSTTKKRSAQLSARLFPFFSLLIFNCSTLFGLSQPPHSDRVVIVVRHRRHGRREEAVILRIGKMVYKMAPKIIE